MSKTRSPLDLEAKRIDLSTEEQWFVYRVLRGRLRRAVGGPEEHSIAATLGKVEAGVSSFTVREARRLKEAVRDHARGSSVSLVELALSMSIIERIERKYDLPETDGPGE